MKPLNLTQELERLTAEICAAVPEFSHIDPSRLLICLSSTRSGGVSGTFAKIHPLRFAGGSRTGDIIRGTKRFICESPLVTSRGTEILYLVYFLFPRFFDLPLRDKLVTVFHELYHVSPDFDGDLRRFPGRNYAHGSSRKKYNLLMEKLVDRYVEAGGETPEFMKKTAAELRKEHLLLGRKMKAPKLKVLQVERLSKKRCHNRNVLLPI